jgi:hypothetical protein
MVVGPLLSCQGNLWVQGSKKQGADLLAAVMLSTIIIQAIQFGTLAGSYFS